jgi:hypothetical protein
MDANSLERDPVLRLQIWEFHINLQDEIWRAYFKVGSNQSKLSEYPLLGPDSYCRLFQASLFKTNPNWFEYSPPKKSIFCLLCYVFPKKSTDHLGRSYPFTVKYFDNWKKVNDGINCPLIGHVGRERSKLTK